MPFNSIFSWLIKKRIHQIDLFKKYPIEVQEELLTQLLDCGKQTKYGKANNFDQIKSYEDFNAIVPLQRYDAIMKWIDREVKGEKDVLWPGETKWFAKSSGTTADRSKFIPVTKESIEGCHYKGGKDLLSLYYTQNPETKLYNGKHLVIGGSSIPNPNNTDSYIGDLSAIIVKNLPWWAEIKRTPSREITLMKNWDEKLEKMAKSTMEEDISILTGVPSWTLVLLHKVLELSGKQYISEVWPNLELFMHGGVSFEPYKKEFQNIINNPKMNYVENYNASEGFFGIQDKKDGDLLLMLDYGVFYEFIPFDKYNGVDSETVIPLKDIELNKNYVVVITTNGGLWRYIIGDTISFTEKCPYRFKVTGRTKSFINTFGEELIVENAEQAIVEACNATNAQVKDYTAAPVFMKGEEKGAHEWLIEFITPPNNEEYFKVILDQTLKDVNSDYQAKREKNLNLKDPIIHFLDKGIFDKWLQSNDKLGGQHKVPRLCNNRKVVDEVKKFMNISIL